MPEQNIRGLQNLYEGAYLLAKGFKLVGKKKDGSKIVVFFEGPEIHAQAMGYYNGARIEAKKYSDSYRTLKDYIFEK